MGYTDQDAGPERAAVELMRGGSMSGLETLVRLHQSRALQAAYAITHSQTAAEDVVADAFLRAYERIGRFDPSRPFGPWFLRMVINLSIKEANRVAMRKRLHVRWAGQQPEPVDPAHAVEGRDEALHLRLAVRKLSPRLRAVLVLHYFLDLNVTETAAVLDCPVGTVKRRLHDARQILHDRLMRDCEPGVVSQMEKRV
jgi:RNA polymerase sigma-70 factor, ECF subfamily